MPQPRLHTGGLHCDYIDASFVVSRARCIDQDMLREPQPPLADEGGDRVVAEPGADVQRHELLGLDRGRSTYGASAAAQECPENTRIHVEAPSRDPANKYDRSIMEILEPVY